MGVLTIAALAAGVVIDGSVRTEARGGSSVGGVSPNAAGVSAGLQGRSPTSDAVFLFGLSPSAVLAQGRHLFARGFGEADLRLGGEAWARLRQGLGYGSADLSPVSPAPARGPVQPPPGRQFINIVESETALELDVKPSRRLQIVGSAAWVVSGGADAEARAFLPLSRGPRVRVHLDWSATRLDTLAVEAQAIDYRYLADQPSNDRRASLASLALVWRTRKSRSLDLSLFLGQAVGRSQAAGQRASVSTYALGAADLGIRPARDWSASIGVSVEPLGDPLSGEIVERGSLRMSASWARPGGVALAARLIGSVALNSGAGGQATPQAGDRYLQGELATTVPLDSRSSIALGARAAFLSRPLLDQPSEWWVVFASYVAQVSLLR
jgi:hypothetical protein